MVESAMPRGYGLGAARPRHPRSGAGTADVIVAAAAVALSVATRWWFVVVAAGLVVAVARSPRVGLLVAVLAGTGLWRADAAWAGLRPDTLGPFGGWARVVSEPERAGAADRVVLEVDGERYEAWVRGRVRRRRVDEWRA